MKRIFGIACLVIVAGCSTPNSGFTGSLADIKNEQRGRLTLQCLENINALVGRMPELATHVSNECRDWGRRRVW